MSIVLSETADTGQAIQLASLLIAVDGAEFRQAHGQIAVAARFRLINLNVMRAIHRLEQVAFLIAQPGEQGASAIGSVFRLEISRRVDMHRMKHAHHVLMHRLQLGFLSLGRFVCRNIEMGLLQELRHLQFFFVRQHAGRETMLGQIERRAAGWAYIGGYWASR